MACTSQKTIIYTDSYNEQKTTMACLSHFIIQNKNTQKHIDYILIQDYTSTWNYYFFTIFMKIKLLNRKQVLSILQISTTKFYRLLKNDIIDQYIRNGYRRSSRLYSEQNIKEINNNISKICQDKNNKKA